MFVEQTTILSVLLSGSGMFLSIPRTSESKCVGFLILFSGTFGEGALPLKKEYFSDIIIAVYICSHPVLVS